MAPAQSKPVQVDGADKVCFLDLPPEIRNTIYEICLVRARGPEEEDPNIELGTAVVRRGRWWHSLDRQPHLLCVCKQIYEEAMPVLYGNCMFELSAEPNYPILLSNAAGAKERRQKTVEQVRLVRISSYKNQRIFQNILRKMKAISNLAVVEISYVCRINFKKPSTLSKALLPLLEQLISQAADMNSVHAINRLSFQLLPEDLSELTGERYITQAFADETKELLRASLT